MYEPNGGTDHYFGMDLSYDYGFEQNQYNGNIAGVKWRSQSSDKQKTYGFEYDKVNRLTKADYNQLDAPSTWAKTLSDFSTDYSYDANGNILSLMRKGTIAGTITTIDDLSYDYGGGFGAVSKGNQLQAVQDTEGDMGQGDFKDGNTSGADYQYDANGNMKDDLNKGITNITYNHLNLPVTVSFGNNKTISYTYDAAGIKLAKEVNDNGDITITDYAGGFIYENNAPTIGRWNKLDRFLEMYMPVSPYGYVANDPINHTDFNGDYIVIFGKDKEGHQYSVLYEGGKAYHYSQDKDGNITKGDEYDGENSFIENTVANLNKIGTTGEGKKVVGELEGSDARYSIGQTAFRYSRFSPNKQSETELSPNGGGDIYYSGETKFLDGVKFKGVYNLGHELYHAYQRELGANGYLALSTEQGKGGQIPLAEIQAVGFENYLRASFNERGFNSVRETYAGEFMNIAVNHPIKEFRYQRGWPRIGAGWTVPWDLNDFINKKEEWINLRKVAEKKYSSK